MTTTSLSLLERAARQGDTQSWYRLEKMYGPLIAGWLRRFGLQHADSEDLKQDVLATVARELSSFQHNDRKGAFRTWLRAILVNRVRYFLRSRRNDLASGRSSVLEQLDQLADERSDMSRLWIRNTMLT